MGKQSREQWGRPGLPIFTELQAEEVGDGGSGQSGQLGGSSWRHLVLTHPTVAAITAATVLNKGQNSGSGVCV